MPEWTPKDISTFQKLYAKEYGEKLNSEEASVRITALVELISLAIEIEKSKTQQGFNTNNANGSLSEPKES